jgi:hypothetical protein
MVQLLSIISIKLLKCKPDSLTMQSRVLSKPIVTPPLKKFPAYYET